MKVAAIDVGTNSFHLLIGTIASSGAVETIDRQKDMVRLGDSAFRGGGVISPEAFLRASDALRSFRRLAERHGCEAILAVATSAVREAQNGGDFVRAMRDETGVELEVISGEEEARLIYLGARNGLGLNGKRALLCDIGGGSVEIMVGDARELYHQRSLKMGVLRLLSRVTTDPISADERVRLAEYCHRVLEKVAGPMQRIGFDFLSISAGTGRALAELCGAPVSAASTGAGGRLRRVRFADIYALEGRLCALSQAERARLPGLDPRRVDSILPGVILVRSLLEVFHADEYVLCEAALREGLIQDYALRHRPGLKMEDEFPDPRRRAVVSLMRRTHTQIPHAQQVARLALDLFRGLRPLHGLSNADGEMLEFSALLHDVGYYISASKHHKHGQYLIENMELPGFSEEEVRLLSNLVRYHRKSTPKEAHPAYAALGEGQRRKVKTLAAMLRVADGLDRTCQGLVTGVRCNIAPREIELVLAVRPGDLELELWSARRKADLLEEVFQRKLRLVVEVAARDDLEELGTEQPPRDVRDPPATS